MKIKTFISLFAIAFLLTACPDEKPTVLSTTPLEDIQNNKMDFPDLRLEYYKGIDYKLSSLFKRSSYSALVIQDDAEVRVIRELELFFSVEVFNEDDAIEAQYNFETEIDLLDAVHETYCIRRINTLEESTVSIKKIVPESVGYPGYIQVISGARSKNQDQTTYFLSTLEVDGKYYVFQLIGKKENMGYLHDDFIDIISSVTL